MYATRSFFTYLCGRARWRKGLRAPSSKLKRSGHPQRFTSTSSSPELLKTTPPGFTLTWVAGSDERLDAAVSLTPLQVGRRLGRLGRGGRPLPVSIGVFLVLLALAERAEDHRVHVLRDVRVLRQHPQGPGSGHGVATDLDVKVTAGDSAAADVVQWKLERLRLAVVVGDLHQAEGLVGQADVVRTEQVLGIAQSLLLKIHFPDVLWNRIKPILRTWHETPEKVPNFARISFIPIDMKYQVRNNAGKKFYKTRFEFSECCRDPYNTIMCLHGLPFLNNFVIWWSFSFHVKKFNHVTAIATKLTSFHGSRWSSFPTSYNSTLEAE